MTPGQPAVSESNAYSIPWYRSAVDGLIEAEAALAKSFGLRGVSLRSWQFEACVNALELVQDEVCRLRGRADRPRIICLCGSTRFTEQMLIKQWELTKEGHVVLSWCALPDSYFFGDDKTHVGDQEGVKEVVDEVHKRKIDIADEILVINIDGYYGDSTRSEIAYAREHGKPVRWLEPSQGGNE